jgi:hypothetical protein
MFDQSRIPKKDEHTHGQFGGRDEDLRRHVREQHDIEGQPHLLNDANTLVLIQEHQKAHHADPISFEEMGPPLWI